MIWKNLFKTNHLHLILFFVFVFSCLFLSVAGSSSVVFASDFPSGDYDISQISPDGKFYICGGTSDYVCSDYSGILFSTTSDVGSSLYLYFDTYGASFSFARDSFFTTFFDFSLYSSSDGHGSPPSFVNVNFEQRKFHWSLIPKDLGTLSISENGHYDVSSYSQVDVNVTCPDSTCPSSPGSSSGSGLSDEQVQGIIKAIYVIPATLFVLYFFYCIFRLFMRSTGGR